MNKPVVEVHVRAIVASSGGHAVFLGNEEKVFVILVDPTVGEAIVTSMAGTPKERPLTHDLLANILRALEAKIERVVVNDLKNGTYFVRWLFVLFGGWAILAPTYATLRHRRGSKGRQALRHRILERNKMSS